MSRDEDEVSDEPASSESIETHQEIPVPAPAPAAEGEGGLGENATRQWDAEQVETITRTVLTVLAAQQGAKEQEPRKGRWLGYFEFLSSHWPVIAFLLAVLGIGIASITEGLSPLYPFKELAFKQRELAHKERSFAHNEAVFARAEFEKQEAQRLVTFARLFLDVEQFAEAKRVYEEALALDPTNTGARAGLLKSDVYALATAKQYDSEVVRKRLENLLVQDPDDPHAHTALGNIYADIDKEKAIEHYSRASNDPNVAGARFGLGYLLLQEAKYDRAIPLLEEAVSRSPWNLRYLESLAYAHWQGGKLERASVLYDSVLRLDPDYVSPIFEYSIALREAGRLQEAVAQLQRLLSLLGNATIMALEKNAGVLWFPTEKGTPVILHAAVEKRAYALYTLAATLHLLDDEAAAFFAAEAEGIELAEWVDVKALVASDLARLVSRRPDLRSKQTEFASVFLTGK